MLTGSSSNQLVSSSQSDVSPGIRPASADATYSGPASVYGPSDGSSQSACPGVTGSDPMVRCAARAEGEQSVPWDLSSASSSLPINSGRDKEVGRTRDKGESPTNNNYSVIQSSASNERARTIVSPGVISTRHLKRSVSFYGVSAEGFSGETDQTKAATGGRTHGETSQPGHSGTAGYARNS